MTSLEYIVLSKQPGWKFSRVVAEDSFLHVNQIHPLKQKMLVEIVAAARQDKYVKRLIVFGSSIRYDCDITSDLDICIEWTEDCLDKEGVFKPFTRNMRGVISKATEGNNDVVDYDYLEDTYLEDAVKKGVVVYVQDV